MARRINVPLTMLGGSLAASPSRQRATCPTRSSKPNESGDPAAAPAARLTASSVRRRVEIRSGAAIDPAKHGQASAQLVFEAAAALPLAVLDIVPAWSSTDLK